MARRLTDELNELKIQDNISGTEILLFYRMPTTAERAAYANESFRRRGNKIEARVVESRQKFGKLILAGIREGDFEVLGRNGEYLPISSDPASGSFRPDWKEKVSAHAGDLLELLAVQAFDGSAVAIAASAERDSPAAEGEDAEKN